MRGPRRAVLCWLLAALGAAGVARGELVLFTHGGFLKVTRYAVDGGRVHLELASGGVLTVRLMQVERIVEDEVGATLAPVGEAEAPPAFELRFDAAQPRPEVPYGELIYSAAERHALNPALVAAVVRAESAFAPRAVSRKGAQGLMQLMPATAERFGLSGEAVFEPARNLDAGARYLRWLADRFEDRLPHVLAAYNAGEGTVERYRGVPPYRETRAYLRRIYDQLGLSWAELESVAR